MTSRAKKSKRATPANQKKAVKTRAVTAAAKPASKARKSSPGPKAKSALVARKTTRLERKHAQPVPVPVTTVSTPAPVREALVRVAESPHLSIVIPVYNEEGILRGSVLELREKLAPFGFSYELLLCENGSRDRTVEIGKELEAEHRGVVRLLSLGQPNYGLAMKMGIENARGTFVICDEIDLLDTEFYARALALLERTETDLVVGSKAMVGSNDQRPLFRRTATRVYNGLLRLACQYQGTDTHGLKAFRRDRLLDTLGRCVLDKDVFASEFVIRAHRERKKVVEVPFTVREKRPPSIRLLKRVPHVLRSVARLAMSVRRSEV